MFAKWVTNGPSGGLEGLPEPVLIGPLVVLKNCLVPIPGHNWQMPLQIDTAEPIGARPFLSVRDEPLQKSLFAPAYESEFNNDEKEVTVSLDGSFAWDDSPPPESSSWFTEARPFSARSSS